MEKSNDFMKNLGFPSSSDQIIEDDGSVNEYLVMSQLFELIKGSYVQIGIMAKEVGDITLPATTVTAKAECVMNIFGSYLELIDVSGDQTYLKSKHVLYHPKNSGLDTFGACCANFAQNHNPKSCDLLILNITDILFVKKDDKVIFEYLDLGEHFDLILNGKSLFD